MVGIWDSKPKVGDMGPGALRSCRKHLPIFSVCFGDCPATLGSELVMGPEGAPELLFPLPGRLKGLMLETSLSSTCFIFLICSEFVLGKEKGLATILGVS